MNSGPENVSTPTPAPHTVRVLVAGDDATGIPELLREFFANTIEIEFLSAASGSEIEAAVGNRPPDWLILDEDLVDTSADVVLQRLSRDGRLPDVNRVLVLSAVLPADRRRSLCQLGVETIDKPVCLRTLRNRMRGRTGTR